MKLNLSPVLTTRNYGINSAQVCDSIFCSKVSKFANVKVENDCNFLQKTAKNSTFSCKIGEKFDEQLQNNANIDLCFDIKKFTDKPLVLSFDFDASNATLVDKIGFYIAKGVEAKVILSFKSDVNAYHNGLVKFVCQEGSKLDVALVSDFKECCTNVLRIESELEASATLNVNVVDFGGKVDIQRYYCRLAGECAVSNLNCLYVAGGESFVDLNFEQDVFGQRCKADIQTIGALLGNARKHFKGTINFEKGCKKSVGCEDELCLLLSKNAKSKALPMILCGEEDVDGKHSSSVGKVGENELFYIMSRGLSQEEALKLVVKAKFNILLEKIFDETLKEKLIEIVDRKLSDEN